MLPISAINQNSTNFKAKLDLKRVNSNLSEWKDTSRVISQTTKKFTNYVLILDEKQNSITVRHVKEGKVKFGHDTYSVRGGLSSLLEDGVKDAAKTLKMLLQKVIGEKHLDEMAYAFASKIENNSNFDAVMDYCNIGIIDELSEKLAEKGIRKV